MILLPLPPSANPTGVRHHYRQRTGAATPYLNRTNDDDTTPDTPPYSYLNTAHTPPAQPHLTPTARPHTQPQHQQLRSLIRPPNTLHSLPSSLPPSLPPASHRTPVPRRHLPVAPGTDTRRRPGTRNPEPEPPRADDSCRLIAHQRPAISDERRATSTGS